MASGRFIVIAALALAASGCAARGTRDHLTRLQSQVGLLDERVAQLERVGSASTVSPSSTTDSGWTGAEDSRAAKRKSSSAVAVHASKKSAKTSSSEKPSTKEIQEALKAAGFYQGSVDGKMGALTRQAVEEFQRINGLKADGVVGHQTWSKLRQYAELSSSDSTTVLK